jgi:hypothetical protein
VGIKGKWTYRSFHNRPEPVGDDAEKALALIFAEAVMAFEAPSDSTVKGQIDWPGEGLDLHGTIRPARKILSSSTLSAPADPALRPPAGLSKLRDICTSKQMFFPGCNEACAFAFQRRKWFHSSCSGAAARRRRWRELREIARRREQTDGFRASLKFWDYR